MNIKTFLQDEGSVRLGLWLGRTLSLPAGRKLAGFIGAQVSKRNSKMVRAIKANQWVVTGEKLDKDGLNGQTEKVLRHIVVSLFEYFYYYQHKEECLQRIQLSPSILGMLKDYKEKGITQILLGPHIGNFDLFGMMLASLGLSPFVLSYPNPNNAYKMQNKLREAAGMKISPISFSTYRQAKQALREGYCLITGLDRPLDGQDESKYRPYFFGRPASVPSFYVRLALDTGAPVRVACGIVQPDHSFYYDCSDPIGFERKDDLQAEIICNAEKVLIEAEKFIQSAPDQWAMFYPVWPEVSEIIEADN